MTPNDFIIDQVETFCISIPFREHCAEGFHLVDNKVVGRLLHAGRDHGRHLRRDARHTHW